MKSQKALGICILVLLAMLPLGYAEPQLSLSTDTSLVGGTIGIAITGAELASVQLIIKTKGKMYKYGGALSDYVQFSPIEMGTHIVELQDLQGSVIAQTSFEAAQEELTLSTKQSNEPTISLTRDQYVLGEQVIANIASPTKDYKLYYEYGGLTQRYMGDSSKIEFKPRGIGIHKLYMTVDDVEVAQQTFTVSESESTKLTPRVMVRTNIGDSIQNYKILRTIKHEDPLLETVDLEIRHASRAVEKVTLLGVQKRLGQGPNIGIEDIPTDKIQIGKRVVQSYAIDPTSLNFTNGTASITAMGTELWKCKEWNYQSQSCQGTWTKLQDITPGQRYDIEINSQDPGYAETGLVTINTDKSLYHPLEKATIYLTVLDKQGYLVSGKTPIITVTNPSLQNHTVQALEISPGIYSTIYEQTAATGEYYIFAEIEPDNNLEVSQMQSSFTVESWFEFDIIRTAPLSINPYTGEFEAAISIISYVQGSFSLIERLPPGISVLEPDGATLDQTANTLTWQSLTNGSEVRYKLQAPLLSPELYILGPAMIDYGSIFIERKPWLIAADPSASSRPTAASDPSGIGTNLANAYDASHATSTTVDIDGQTNPAYITYTAFNISGINNNSQLNSMNISFDVITSGAFTNDAWYLEYTNDTGTTWYTCYTSTAASARQNLTCALNTTGWTVQTFANQFQARIGGDRNGPADTVSLSVFEIWAQLNYTAPNSLPEPKTVAVNQSSVYANNSISFNASWIDPDGNLSHWTFSWNISGTWVNETWTAFTSNNISNITKIANATVGTLVAWRFYANDTQGAVNSTPIMNFTIYAQDNSPPAVWNENVTPKSAVAGTIFNITANITDNQIVAGTWAEIMLPNGTKINYTMTSGGSGYYYLQYNSTYGGNFSFIVYAYDGKNTNYSSTRTYFNVTANLTFNKSYYVRGEKAILTGTGFSPQSTVTLNITNYAGQLVTGFPVNVTTNSTGGFQYQWNISSETSFATGQYNASAFDNSYTWLSAKATSNVVIKPTTTYRVSDNPGGPGLISESQITRVNDSDNVYSNIRSSNVEVYLSANFTNVVPLGYDVTNATLYFEHYEISTASTYVKWYNWSSGLFITLCTIPSNTSETFSSCDLSSVIKTPEDANNLSIRLSDDNTGNNNNNWTMIDFVYLQVRINASSSMTIVINEPANPTNNYNYSSSLHKAYYGSNADQPPATFVNDTAFTSNGYSNITYQDGINASTRITGATNLRVYQEFNFLVSDFVSDISAVTFTHTGYATGSTSLTADPFTIYAWNYTSNSYVLVRSVSASSSLVTTSITLNGNNSDLINATTGLMWFLVEGSHVTTGGPNAQADIHTDYAALTVSKVPTLSGIAAINATALDSDTVAGCNYFYTYQNNTLASSYYSMSSYPNDIWFEYSDTSLYDDGYYNLYVNCTDVPGTSRENKSILVKIANSAPAVLLMDPPNYANITYSNINFTWYVSSQSPGVSFCNLTIDNSVRLSDVISLNNQNTTKNYTLTDGVHYWNVTCRDLSSLTNTSQNWQIDVDTTAPQITQNYPTPALWLSIYNLTLNYTPTDAHSMPNCSLYLNGVYNQTNSTISNGAINQFRLISLGEGRYNWTVYCIDTFNWTGSSPTTNFTIDRTRPTINLLYPPSPYNASAGNVTFNYTVTDNLDYTLTCNLTIDDQVSTSNFNIASANGTNMSITETNLADGLHYWNITCWDDAYNTNTSETRYFNMTGPPRILLNSPKNATWVNSSNVTFNYYVEDGDGIANCSLYLDGSYNQTANNTQVSNYANNTFNVSYISQGYHSWYVLCYDTNFGPSISVAYNFTVDTSPPSLIVHEPPTDTLFNETTVNFNFTVTDNLDSNLTCNLTINGVVSTTNSNIQALNGSLINLTESDLTDGYHYWNITCLDDAGNKNTSVTRNFTIDIYPAVTLIDPENNSYKKSNVTFLYYVSDLSGLANCSIIIDGQKNQTVSGTNLTNFANNTFNLTGLTQGLHTWLVNCTDTGGREGTSQYRNITIDSTSPYIIAKSPNGTSTSNSSVPFNFTAYDTTSQILNCTVNVDNGLYTNTTIANNASNTTIVISGIADGLHYWNVTCLDLAGNTNTSNTLNFSVDSSPQVYLDEPYNGTGDPDGNITFTYEVYEGNLTNCSLIINGQRNQTLNASDIPHISDGQTNNFTLYEMAEGAYNWTVTCFDDNGFSGSGTTRELYVDKTRPYNVTLHEPLQNQTLYQQDITFNWTVYDNIGPYLTCDLLIGDQVNKTNITAYSGIPASTQVFFQNAGTYNWSVNCTDRAGFSQNSTTRNFTISSEVRITLIAPENQSTDGDGNVTFFYKPESFVGFETTGTCELYLDGSSNQTGVNPVSGATNNLTITGIGQGTHTWYVNCTDDNFNYGVSQTRTLYVDLTDPWIVIEYPLGQIIPTSSVNFNYTAYDNLDNDLTCNISVDGSVILSSINSTNGSATNRTIFGFNDGLHFYNITCLDNGLRYNTSSTENFTIAEPPMVSLQSPPDWYRTNAVNLTVLFTATDNSGNISNCTLILNGAPNQTIYSVINGTQANFSIQNLTNGTYTWDVNCSDNSSNYAVNGTALTFIVDLSPPVIELQYPTPGQIFNTNNITFNWTAFDYNSSVLLNCTLFVTDPLTDITVQNITDYSSSVFTYTLSNLSDGPHFWNVTCIDDLNNTGLSETWNFTINQPDLYVDNGRIAFNNTNPDENQTINITVNVSNIGGVPATNVLVEFWDGLPGSGVFIGNHTGNVASNSSSVFSVVWNISYGYHTIYVAVDPYNAIGELDESNNNASANISLLLARINAPTNGTAQSSPNVTLNFTLQDFTGSTLNYTIYVDGVATGNGTATDNISRTHNQTLAEGIHQIRVQATDILGRSKNSSVTYITIDYTAPNTTILTQNQTWYNYSTPQINFTSTDNIDTLINYTLFVNGTPDLYGSIINGSSVVVNLTSHGDGIYEIIVQGTDDLNNSANSSARTIYIDTTKPTITLVTPSDGSNFSTRNVTLNFTATDNLAPYLTCNLTLDGNIVSGYNITSGSYGTYNATNLTEGAHYWNVTCTDIARNANTSSTWQFNVYSPPIITLIAPTNASWTNTANTTFYFNASDETGLENCTLLLNGSAYATKNNSELTNNAVNNFSINGLDSGNYTWAVTCTDNTTFKSASTSETRNYYVDLVAPQPYIETRNGTWYNTPNPSVLFNITDNMAPTLNYTFYSDGEANKNGTVNNSQSTVTALANLSSGAHDIVLQGTDWALNSANSSSVTILVDLANPYVMLEAPTPGEQFNQTFVQFNFTAYDNMAPYMTCNLTVSGGHSENLINSSNASQVSINKTSFTSGTYYWNVTCIDLAGNYNTSETRNFTISAPDLFISSANISFNQSTDLEENTNITIFANVFNIGGIGASNITVQFYIKDPDSGGIQINGNITISSLSSGQNYTVNVTHQTVIGDNNIYVLVDPPTTTNGSIIEENESNNKANRSLYVSINQVYAGNVTGILLMQRTSINRTLYDWNVSNSTGSNILVTDLEANPNFLTLQAIGRNMTNQTTVGDFSDIDQKIYSTNYSDNVNNSYTINEQPKSTRTFTIFTKTVGNVPIINSTNTSNFVTGIIWDYSDGGTEYNGSQDILFITEINQNQIGSRGTYDFEIRVPALMRNYVSTGSAVAFYTEIK